MITQSVWSWDFSDDALFVDEALGMDQDLRTALVINGWTRNSFLAAAFDSYDEAVALVDSLGLYKLEHDATATAICAQQLMDWKDSVGARTASRRRRVVTGTEEGRVYLQSFHQKRTEKLVNSTLPSALAKACVPEVWKTRRHKKLDQATTPELRLAVEEKERSRWALQLLEYIKDAGLPLVEQAALSSNPEGAMYGAIGTLRARTLRARVRTWDKVSRWLWLVHSVSYPRHVGDVLDYLEDLKGQDCGKTVPAAMMSALMVIERVGGVVPEDRISEHPLLKSNLKALEASLRLGTGGTVVHKAPPFCLKMVIALELYICSDRPRYKRGLAWVRLIKLWCCMRFDDTRGVRPSRLRMGPQGLRGVIERSKTTGADKKTGELPIFVARHAGFSGRDWLREGFETWQHSDLSSDRDYLLPLATPDFQGAVMRPAEYYDASAWGRQLLADLSLPVRGLPPRGPWEEHFELSLFTTREAALHFTEHSERHFVPSIGAAILIEKGRRDYMGRWGVDSSHQSNDYVVSARKIITGVQQEICEALSNDTKKYDEEDIYQELKDYLEARRVPEHQVRSTVSNLRIPLVGGEFGLRQPWPLVEFERPEVLTQEMDDEIVRDISQLQLEDLERPAEKRKRAGSSMCAFWFSISDKKGFKRLHRRQGCGTKPEDCHMYREIDTLDGIKVDAKCKHCWPPDEPEFLDSSSETESESSMSSGSSVVRPD